MHIVKRKGHRERYDGRKVYASVYYACRSTHMKHGVCEKTAASVSGGVNKWIRDKKTVTSAQISREAAKRLRKLNANAAFMYETHRDIS